MLNADCMQNHQTIFSFFQSVGNDLFYVFYVSYNKSIYANVCGRLVEFQDVLKSDNLKYDMLESFCCKKSPNQEISLRRFSEYRTSEGSE